MTTVVIEVEGGVVNLIVTDALVPIRVIVLDLDTEGGDEDQIRTVNGTRVYVRDDEAEPGAAYVQSVIQELA